MEAYEFQTKIMPDGKIEVPGAFFKKLKRTQVVRVIVLINEPLEINPEEQTWKRLTEEQFLAGYSEDDAVYDKVS